MSVGELFGAAAHVMPGLPAAARTSGSDLPYYDSAEDDVIGRRRFLAWLAALSAGTVALPDSVRHTISVVTSQNPDTLDRITADDVANLRATTEVFRAWGHKVGGGPYRHAVIGQLGWAVHQLDMRVPASSALRREWQMASALLAAVAGWNSHDGGHEQQARGLMVLGYRLAAEADAAAIQAYLLSKLAKQAVHVGRPKTGLDLARHGLELADDATPITRAMLHALKAQAHGRMGDIRTLDREVGLAGHEYSKTLSDDRDREPWLRSFSEARLYGDTGTAWQVLAWHHRDHVSERAVTETGSRLSLAAHGYGAEFARSRAMCHLMAAGIYMRARDPDAAMAVGKGAASVSEARGIYSVRVEGYARELERASQPFRARSDVQDMIDSLAAAH